MATGENEEEVSQFLHQMQNFLGMPPRCVTIDHSPALKASVQSVFPHTIIGYDYFHTSKILNRALRKEIMRLQRIQFNDPIKKFRNASRKSLAIEKKKEKMSTLSSTDTYLQEAWIVLREVHKINNVKSFKDFINTWETTLNHIEQSKWQDSKEFLAQCRKIPPLCGLSSKNYSRISIQMWKLWRKFLRNKRNMCEQEKSKFVKAKYSVLRNPVNMSRKGHKELSNYLKLYPWMRPIREAVRKFHYQFRASRSSWRNLKFLEKIVQKDSHEELKGVVKSFVNNYETIFAYRQIWAQYPDLENCVGIRSNREEVNRRINLVARNQYGFRTLQNTRSRLAGILKCPIIISKALMEVEMADL
ncbi:MAG: transposase [Promethearchaeota archaeon]